VDQECGLILMGKDFEKYNGYTPKVWNHENDASLISSSFFPGNQGGPLMKALSPLHRRSLVDISYHVVQAKKCKILFI
jgi:hypothetical protein